MRNDHAHQRAERGRQRDGQARAGAALQPPLQKIGHGIEIDREDDGQENDQQHIDGADEEGHHDDGEQNPAEWEPSPSSGYRRRHQRVVPFVSFFDQLGVMDVAAAPRLSWRVGPAPVPARAAPSRP